MMQPVTHPSQVAGMMEGQVHLLSVVLRRRVLTHTHSSSRPIGTGVFRLSLEVTIAASATSTA